MSRRRTGKQGATTTGASNLEDGAKTLGRVMWGGSSPAAVVSGGTPYSDSESGRDTLARVIGEPVTMTLIEFLYWVKSFSIEHSSSNITVRKWDLTCSTESTSQGRTMILGNLKPDSIPDMKRLQSGLESLATGWVEEILLERVYIKMTDSLGISA
jgi:hypothetical protein